MKIVKTLLVLGLLALLVWIDLPQKLPFNMAPPKLQLSVFGYKIQKEFKTHLGLDLQGGSHLVFEADISKVKSADLQDAVTSARDIIEKRVNFFGVSEPSVQTVAGAGKYRIVVDLPGATDIKRSVELIGKTAELTFREGGEEKVPMEASAPGILNLQKESGLKGRHVKKASAAFDPQNGKPQVLLEFSSEGTKLFAEVTRRNVGRPVGIFIDEFLISAPVVQTPILEGTASITGTFTTEEAKQLAISINSGALPLPIHLVEQRNIGPTLGAEEVRKSVFAGVVGLSAVALFMILYYRKMGVIAVLGLLLYGLISFAVFRTIPVVLTLSGVAGFLLSIGMAVDSNILIFERIKEELRAGRDMDIAIRLGFGRAIDAIKDANITTIIVSLILFNPLNWSFFPQFGLVRGFAVTLLIGVVTSLFTGVVITKRLINAFYKIR